jgi:adenosylmethionine-8-amino-7-oxononanoate aminotransferase
MTMAQQAMQMAYYSPWYVANAPSVDLARRIAEVSPGDLNHVFYTTGGSTAVDSALRFVMFYNNIIGRPEKKKIIAREAGYHGSTYLSASCSGKERDKVWLDFDREHVHHIPCPNPNLRDEGQSVEDFLEAKVADLENKILELGPDKVACFIAEPIMASGGLIIPPKGYHQRCMEVCRKYEVLYISDEVVTGFGRLGHWFASKEVFGIEPDIITCAKGITSGYVPLGAVLISESLMARVQESNQKNATFSNGFTYSAHPVSCAVALKNMEIMERDGIMEHVREIGPYFQERLAELKDIPIVYDVRGEGLMACVECDITSEGDDALAMDKAIGNRIDEHCQELGLIVRPLYNMCVMSPPLIITKSQIDDMVAILREGIIRAMKDVENEGLWSPKKLKSSPWP